METEGEKERPANQAASGYLFANKKTSRPQPALKRKTGIDVEEDVGRQQLDRAHLVKVYTFLDKP